MATRTALITITFVIGSFAYGQPTESKPAFEVVSIKPAPPPDGRGMTVWSRGGPGSDDPALYRCENFSLISLVSQAYDVPQYRLTAPDWMKSQLFNITAKVPLGATKEQFRGMMQNMLAERFKLSVHRDQKEMQLYELVVAKGGPKLKKAEEPPPEPAEPDAAAKRPAAPEPMKLGADGYPALGKGTTMAIMNGRARLSYPKETMESLAQTLSYQIGRPVTDATGLNGKFDITLFWDAGGSRRAPAADGNTPLAGASDPDSGPTLFEAIQSQLGLRLESKKGPVEIVVVDHAEKIPTEN